MRATIPPRPEGRPATVSDEIQASRERYLDIMHAHGTMSRDAIVESVRETQDELIAIYDAVAEDVAARTPAPGEWSLHQLALHTVFSERLIAKLIHHTARGSMPPAEDLKGAGIGMLPEGDPRPYRQVVDDLRRTNQALRDAVRGLPEDLDTEMTPPHPFFGPLNCLEWAGFQRVHDLDHIQHARKILAAAAD